MQLAPVSTTRHLIPYLLRTDQIPVQQTRLQAPRRRDLVLWRRLDEPHPQSPQRLGELIRMRQVLRGPLEQVNAVGVLDNGAVLDKLRHGGYGRELCAWVIQLALGADLDYLRRHTFVSSTAQGVLRPGEEMGLFCLWLLTDLVVLVVGGPGSLLGQADDEGPVAVVKGRLQLEVDAVLERGPLAIHLRGRFVAEMGVLYFMRWLGLPANIWRGSN